MNTPQEYIQSAATEYNQATLSLIRAARMLASPQLPELNNPICNTKMMIGDLAISTVELNELAKQYQKETNESEEEQAD